MASLSPNENILLRAGKTTRQTFFEQVPVLSNNTNLVFLACGHLASPYPRLTNADILGGNGSTVSADSVLEVC